MNKFRVTVVGLTILFIGLFNTGCETDLSTPVDSRLLSQTVSAPSLEDNLVNESTNQPIVIYLPPTYYDSEQSYPVIYYLPGFTGVYPDLIADELDIQSTMDQLIQYGSIKEMIVVIAHGTNVLDGSFYVNSPVTGNWEDFIKQDVVEFVDNNYRTIAEKNSRGITGHSMGGFGAFHLAMNNPDIFSAVYIIGPGLFDENGLVGAMESWSNPEWGLSVRTAYGAAFSPNTDLEYPYANILNSANDTDNPGYNDWVNGYGGFDQKVIDNKSNLEELRGIVIDYGINDSFTWIPDGCEYLSDQLESQNIPHTLRTHDGDHGSGLSSQLTDFILPFFSETLIGAP